MFDVNKRYGRIKLSQEYSSSLLKNIPLSVLFCFIWFGLMKKKHLYKFTLGWSIGIQKKKEKEKVQFSLASSYMVRGILSCQFFFSGGGKLFCLVFVDQRRRSSFFFIQKYIPLLCVDCAQTQTSSSDG